jgi:hypothetical protein
MRIEFAHFGEAGTDGRRIECAVFHAKANSGFGPEKTAFLEQLTAQARFAGYRIDKSALVYEESGRIQYWGADDLVKLLARNGIVPHATNYIVV